MNTVWHVVTVCDVAILWYMTNGWHITTVSHMANVSDMTTVWLLILVVTRVIVHGEPIIDIDM